MAFSVILLLLALIAIHIKVEYEKGGFLSPFILYSSAAEGAVSEIIVQLDIS